MRASRYVDENNNANENSPILLKSIFENMYSFITLKHISIVNVTYEHTVCPTFRKG